MSTPSYTGPVTSVCNPAPGYNVCGMFVTSVNGVSYYQVGDCYLLACFCQQNRTKERPEALTIVLAILLLSFPLQHTYLTGQNLIVRGDCSSMNYYGNGNNNNNNNNNNNSGGSPGSGPTTTSGTTTTTTTGYTVSPTPVVTTAK